MGINSNNNNRMGIDNDDGLNNNENGITNTMDIE